MNIISQLEGRQVCVALKDYEALNKTTRGVSFTPETQFVFKGADQVLAHLEYEGRTLYIPWSYIQGVTLIQKAERVAA